MEWAAGGLILLEELEELLAEGALAPQWHRGADNGEVQRRQLGRGIKVTGRAFLIPCAPQVNGQAEVQASGNLIGVEVSNLSASVVRNDSLVNPSADLVEMALASAAGELAEHIAAEFVGVGTGDSTLLVDPDHRRHVADGIHLGEQVIGVHQHRIGDAVGQYPNFVDGLVDGHRDHHEAVIGQLVMQFLPPGQVEGASSPAGEGNQKPFLAGIVRQAPIHAVEIGESEVGRLAITKGGTAGGVGLA